MRWPPAPGERRGERGREGDRKRQKDGPMQSRREGEVKARAGGETEIQRQQNKAPKNQGREKRKENQGPKHSELWTNDPARGGARGPQGLEGRTQRLQGPQLGCRWGCWWLQGQATEFGYLGSAGWTGVPSPATVGLAGPRGRGVGGGGEQATAAARSPGRALGTCTPSMPRQHGNRRGVAAQLRASA